MATHTPLSKRVVESLSWRSEAHQWEQLIGKLLQRLELDATDRARAEADYEKLASRVAEKLSLPRHDVHVFPQGSMRTQTTIAQQYPVKFDLDVIVELRGPRYHSPEPEAMFTAFGRALEGDEDVTGVPYAKRRCWRLDYPGERYYFDVTPAVRDQTGKRGSSLSVRDPDTRWAPSNPEEFAAWFNANASLRLPFQRTALKSQVEAHTTVAPLPDGEVALDDILRRTVQLIKLHRDYQYRGASVSKKAVMPISVIIVTLATSAYVDLVKFRSDEFKTPIEVVLAIVEAMPDYIAGSAKAWRVDNPALPDENFADRWNDDGGARHAEFMRWHAMLERDLEALLHQSARAPTEERIRSLFGVAGLEAWKASRPRANVLDSLISSGESEARSNPDRPVRIGSSNTLG